MIRGIVRANNRSTPNSVICVEQVDPPVGVAQDLSDRDRGVIYLDAAVAQDGGRLLHVGERVELVLRRVEEPGT